MQRCLLLLLLLSATARAFVVPYNRGVTTTHLKQPLPSPHSNPLIASPTSSSLLKPSLSSTRLMGGLFGLGFGEIFLILVGVGVVLGPEKIKDMIRSSASTAGEFQTELSKVPEEFQKGLEEGEIDARSRKAKEVKAEKIPSENKDPTSS